MATIYPVYAHFFGRCHFPNYIGISYSEKRAASWAPRNADYLSALSNKQWIFRHEIVAQLHWNRHHAQLEARQIAVERCMIGYHCRSVSNKLHLKHSGPLLYDPDTKDFFWREPWMKAVLAEWVDRFPPSLRIDPFGKLRVLASLPRKRRALPEPRGEHCAALAPTPATTAPANPPPAGPASPAPPPVPPPPSCSTGSSPTASAPGWRGSRRSTASPPSC